MRKNRPPLTPELRALVRAQLMTRRSMLAGTGAAALGASTLAACGTGAKEKPKLVAPADRSAAEKVVGFANWGQYMDVDEKDETVFPTLVAFEKKSGLKVSYAEDINSNDEYYGKISGQLANGQDIGKDIVVFTDWMTGRMIKKGYTQEFTASNMPNLKNIEPAYLNVDYDPGRKHSVTWAAGFAGLSWNKSKVKAGLKTIDDLWKPELKGRVVILDEMRDTMGLLLMSDGVDITKPFSSDQFMKGIETLQKQIDSGQIRAVNGGDYTESLKSGDALAAIAWSGDITSLNYELEKEAFGFALPESGGTLWADNSMIPIGSPHKANAEKLIDYYLDPKVAAELAAWVTYICPVKGAQKEMEKIDSDLVENDLIFPSEDYLKNAKVFRTLSDAEELEFTAAYQKLAGN